MAKSSKTSYIKAVNNLQGVIASSDSAGAKIDVWTAGADDAVLKSFWLTSTDTTAKVVQVFVNVGGSGTDRLIGTLTVPIGAGSNGTTAAVDVLRSALISGLSYDALGNKVLHLEAGSVVKISPVAALSSGKEIAAFGEGGDF